MHEQIEWRIIMQRLKSSCLGHVRWYVSCAPGMLELICACGECTQEKRTGFSVTRFMRREQTFGHEETNLVSIRSRAWASDEVLW